MISCPKCGQPVREDAKFCGNCGIDVQAALAAAAQATAAAAEPQPSPYAYPSQQPSYGGYDFRNDEGRSPMNSRLLIVAVLVIAVACAFCCGILFGFEILSPMFPAGPSPTPRPSPTREAMLLLQQVVQWIG